MSGNEKLNLAGRLASLFITSQLTVVFILAIAVLGVLAILQTPREENPQIQMPGALVTVRLPGAPPAEVEELVVRPLEQIITELNGVDHVYSTAQDSQGSVQVMFKVGESKEQSLVRLYDRLLSNVSRLPSDASMPQVTSVDVDDLPVLTVTLASSAYNDYALKRLADRMAERLHSIDDVSVVKVYGGRDRQISVALDPDRLQAFGVTFNQVLSAFSAANLSAELEPTVQDGAVKSLKVQGQLTSIEQIRHLVVGVSGERPILIQDIATLTDGIPPEPTRYSQFSFGPADARFSTDSQPLMAAVTLAVAKKKGANAVAVTQAVKERIRQLQTQFVPQDVQVIVTRDDGKKADDAVNLLMEHLTISVVSVGIILLLFLGWRDALIVMITVPLILAVTLAADYLGHVTINRVTLFALILSLGLLVDAAIVVIENINRHYQTLPDGDKTAMTIDATNEIGNPTNLATLAVMLVFSSLFLITDMAGDYFYPIAYNVPIAMAASVVVAYIVTPWAARRWLKPHSGNSSHPAGGGRIQRLYLRLIAPLQQQRRYRQGFALVVLVLFLLSALQGAWQFIRPSGVGGAPSWLSVPLGFLPKDNKNTFNIVVWMPEDSAVEQTDRLVRDIDGLLATESQVKNWQNWVGQAGVPDFNGLYKGTAMRAGSSVAEVRVNLVDKSDRSESSIAIVKAFRSRVNEVLKRYPGARVSLVEDPPGPPVRSTVLAEIYGPSLTGLRILSSTIAKQFANTWDMVDLVISEQQDIPQYAFIPDKEKAALSGVSVTQIASALNLVYGGETVGRLHPDGEKNGVAVKAYVPRHLAIDPATLHGVYVNNSEGKAIPLSELVKIEHTQAARPILHKDNERVTFVGGELEDSAPLYAVLDLNRHLQSLTAPDGQPLHTGNLSLTRQNPDVTHGYQVLWGGEMRMTLDVYRDMSIALGGALLLVYLLLVAYYQSFRIPLIAMATVPLGLIGIFPGHWLVGAPFSATSMVGIIALSGVVIRNSLLIIDFIRENRNAGMPMEEAARQGGAIRLRPILLTTLAIVLGSAVMVRDPVFGGLAISLIFGTLASTLLTVFVVPLLYQLFGDKAESV